MAESSTTLEPRVCDYEHCGETFRPRKRWQRFCCKEHKAAHHKEANSRLRAVTERYVNAWALFQKEPTDEAGIELAQATRALHEESK